MTYSKEETMKKWNFIIILLGCSVMLTSAGKEITLTNSECSNSYDMEDIDGESVYLTFTGEKLYHDRCSVEFTNFHTWQKQICIKPVRINLGCSTTVEYYRHHITQYFEPEKEITCGVESSQLWCGPERTTNVYIVFKTSGSSESSYIRLHIYLQKLPKRADSYSSSSSSSAVVGSVVGSVVVIFILLGFVIACKVAKQQRQAIPRTPYLGVQTSAAPENVSSNQPLQRPANQPQQQAQFQPGLQGYQLHPMQTAHIAPTGQSYNMGTGYPAAPQVETGRHSPASFHQPTAPPPDNAEPPPSYESVVKYKS